MATNNIHEIAPDGHYTLVHPEHEEVTVKAAVIDWWKDLRGFNIGLELQFPGEGCTRHLRFVEIQRLMLMAIEELMARVRNGSSG